LAERKPKIDGNSLAMNEIRLPVVDGLALDLHGDEAVAEFREGMRLQRQGTSMLCYLGYALAKSGRKSEAEAYQPLRSDPRFLQMIQLVGLPS
jgi:hypothetical protein